jgi:HemY protein
MKLIGFFLRLVVVVALVVWLADRPGTAQITWRDYVIDTTAAVLALIVALMAYAAVLVHRLWRFLWDGPRFWKLNRKISKLEEGQGEVAKGFAALAAGQAAEAGRAAVKARKLLGETPVTRLIQAQAAQLAGDGATARTLFEAMTNDSATAILGYRGLLAAAFRRSDMEEAARIVARVEQAKIEAPWLQLARFAIGSRLRIGCRDLGD